MLPLEKHSKRIMVVPFPPVPEIYGLAQTNKIQFIRSQGDIIHQSSSIIDFS